MLIDYLPIIFILAIGIIIGVSPQIIGRLLRPDNPNPIKQSTYECGIEPKEDTYGRNSIPYYIYGLLFLLFEVEVLFFFLWAVIYRDMMLFAFIEITFFALILFLGLIYAWIKGALDWTPYTIKV